MTSLKTNIDKINKAIMPTCVFLSVCVFLFFSGSFSAQVYVLNGGFEISETVPNQSGQWELMNNWSNAGSAEANRQQPAILKSGLLAAELRYPGLAT